LGVTAHAAAGRRMRMGEAVLLSFVKPRERRGGGRTEGVVEQRFYCPS